MKHFAQLADQLDFRSDPHDKIRLIAQYFGNMQDPDRGIAAGLLIGEDMLGRVTQPHLRGYLEARIGTPRLDLLLELATDQIEAMSIGWPSVTPSNGPPSLSDLVAIMASTSKQDRLEALDGLLGHMEVTERWALLKCLTGRPPGAVSPLLLRQAMARFGRIDENEIHEIWQGQNPPYSDLFLWLTKGGPRPRPGSGPSFRSFVRPMDGAWQDFAESNKWPRLGMWEPPGVLAQLATKNGETRVFTVSGDDISVLLPELTTIAPGDSCRVGYLVMPELDGFVPVSVVDKRLSRKRLDKGLAAQHPVAFWCTRESLDSKDGPEAAIRYGESFVIQDKGDLSGLLSEPSLRPKWAQSLLIVDESEPWPPIRVAFDRYQLCAVLLNGEMRGRQLISLTLGVWKDGALVPIGKSAPPEDTNTQQILISYIQEHTTDRYGPIREVQHSANAGLVLRVSYARLEPAPRRKAGYVLQDSNIIDVNVELRPSEATGLNDLISA